MHIPDGYLSPETALAAYAVAVPVWLRATAKVKKLLVGRTVPLVALFAAFSFIIMMFNVPLPGGTTGHAIATTLTAVVLGPWAAVLTVSIALIIQALFFGDGGILALGANVLNMAIISGFVGYTLYRWLSANTPLTSPRRAVAAAIASYVGINAAALATAIELGLQPLLFHDAAGHALYFPYGLDVSLPSMMLGHLTVAGGVEAIATGLVVSWLQRTEPKLLETFSGASATTGRALKWGWGIIAALLILAPLGLLAPGTAWGEWSREQLAGLGLGYIPAGFDRFSGIWSAPLSGYNLPLLNNPAVGYMFSGLLGVALLLVVLFALGKLLDRILPAERSAPRDGEQWTHEPFAARPAAARRSARGFLEKTLDDLAGALSHTLFAEDLARQAGFLQQLDPRAKLLGALALLLAVSLSHSLAVIAAIYLLTLPAAAASRVPMGFYLKRVWVFMPFFTGIIALPALFNVFTPGPALLTLVDLPPRFYLSITAPGVVTAAFLLLRVGTSVSIGALLVLTTRWATLLKSMRVLRVPQTFVLILGMTYRYIYVLLQAANDMFLARKSRLVGRVSGGEDRRWLTAGMGVLLSRSYNLSDEVYLAMQSRGFRGEVMLMDDFAWHARDWLALALFLVVAAGAIALGR